MHARAAHALRLRRHLGHGAQPLLLAGGDRLPADRVRRGRPDARLPRHSRHGALRRARDDERPPSAASTACSTSSPSSSQSASWPSASRPRGRITASRPRSSTCPTRAAELETHYYNAKHQHLLDLGLVPHKLEDSLIDRVIGLVERYKKRIRPELFVPRVDWRRGGKGGVRHAREPRRRSRSARRPRVSSLVAESGSGSAPYSRAGSGSAGRLTGVPSCADGEAHRPAT